MGKGVNKVIIVGNLGQDPETRYTTNGGAICKLSLATSEQWKDKDGEKQERTEWHRVVLFGKLGEIAAEYLKKGAQVYIEGSLRTTKYTKDGVDKYSTDIIASEMQMLGSGTGNSGNTGNSGGSRDTGNQSRSAPRSGAPPARQAPVQDDPFNDDDIPF